MSETQKNEVKIELVRVGKAAFEATNTDGFSVTLDGPEKIGGEGKGMRPMQLFLASLAGCASMDAVMILEKQKQTIESYRVSVTGVRADAVPAVYESVHMRFELSGEISEKKLERAVSLSVEKYCSVASMLLPDVNLTFEAALV